MIFLNIFIKLYIIDDNVRGFFPTLSFFIAIFFIFWAAQISHKRKVCDKKIIWDKLKARVKMNETTFDLAFKSFVFPKKNSESKVPLDKKREVK